jgi:tetratricopeptide (TPR) repeat protein
MTMRKILLLFLASLSLTVAAQADPWSESYRLESVGKPLDAAAKIESLARNNEYAQLRHAWLLYTAGRFEEAAAGYRRAQQMNPQSLDALLGLSLPLMAQWKWQEAADVVRMVQRKAPGNYTAGMRLIVIFEALKQWKSMAEEATRLVALYPSDVTAWVYLARGEAASGNTDKAADGYRRVLQIVPGHLEATAFLGRK